MTKTTTDNSTPTRPIRVQLDLWDEFGDVAKQLGSNRTALILEFMRWMARRPGAKLPKRPTSVPPAASSS
ncbi:hypothetical protein ABT336_12120 [Micromonospora sp. NPDC000207]|uniref:hypothetical protein n=1 Tax=Micromonospora sp. NPDC000207 TaxID=3154246 RepID=UPI003321CBA0